MIINPSSIGSTSRFPVLHRHVLTTIDVLYYRPDFSHLLQEFIFQDDDVPPDFPRMHRFLRYWHEHIRVPIKSVTLMHVGLIKPAEVHIVDSEFALH